jgi:putative hemolysin
MARKMGGDVHLGQAKDVVADFGLLLWRLGQKRPHSTTLVAGDDHHRTIVTTNLGIASAFCGGHGGHVSFSGIFSGAVVALPSCQLPDGAYCGISDVARV